MNLQNKVAVITGAGSGIGRALALALSKQGAQLSLCDINAEALKETVNSLESSTSAPLQKVVDVSSKAALNNFAEATIQQFGQVDIMINNAGIALGKYSAITVPESDFRKLMEINFWGMVYGSQAFLPHLIKQPEASLVNVSSLFGLIGIAFQSPYCASKFAIRGYTESLIMELKHSAPNVCISSVHPGGVRTNISRSSIPGDPKYGNHERFIKKFEETQLKLPAADAAQTIIKGIKKKKSRIIVGRDARWLDRINRLFPTFSLGLIGKGMKRIQK